MPLTRRGDTIIEVLFGTAIFSLVAVSAISLMNNGLATAESTLELTMARNEISAQAEAIRFIHNTYATNHDNSNYRALWARIINKSNPNNNKITINDCNDQDVYTESNLSKFFALNPRNLNESSSFLQGSSIFSPATTYAHVIFSNGSNIAEDNNLLETRSYIRTTKVEGLWAIAKTGPNNSRGKPRYYDFYIQACWQLPNSSAPSSTDTVMRLYNPENNT